jgi:di/tricarboxylate transporter
MTIEIGLVLGLLVAAIALFATERISVDIITLLMLVVLVTAGILSPGEAFAGFSNEIIIILASIFVISGALHDTGVLDAIGARLMRIAGGSQNRLVRLVMLTACGVSAFMNNTTVTAMFLPPVTGLARRMKISPSKLLMPLAFASILGGTCTLIGTSTNVAVSGYIAKSGMKPLGMFEITPIGLVIAIVGVLYMIYIGCRMLPDTKADDLTADYGIRHYLSEIVVLPNSPLVGQRSYESDLTILDFRILKVIRGREQLMPDSRLFIEQDDVLVVEGKVENLIKVKKIEGIEIKADLKLGAQDLQNADVRVAEALVTAQSDLAGETLRSADFRMRSGLTVLAIYRAGQSLQESLGDVVMRIGDLLLVQGQSERVASLQKDTGLEILGEVGSTNFNPRRGFLTVGFFVAAVALSSLRDFPALMHLLPAGFVPPPLSIALLAVAVLLVLTGFISVENAHEFIDWRLLILIGGMTAFGTAMEKTGAAEWLAHHIVAIAGPFGPRGVLAGFFILTIALTQPMSNAAAALVVLPVAISAAHHMGVNPRTFAIGVMLAASISFIAPFEPSCILVYGPGKYRFMDFVKTGLGLSLVLCVAVLLLLPVFWPL